MALISGLQGEGPDPMSAIAASDQLRGQQLNTVPLAAPAPTSSLTGPQGGAPSPLESEYWRRKRGPQGQPVAQPDVMQLLQALQAGGGPEHG
jgi:hypothetical protein